jgi:hypothetical protein
MTMLPPLLGRKLTQDRFARLRELFNMENELITEEIAVYREIAKEYGEQSTNRLRGLKERDDLMRRLRRLNGDRI